MLHGAGIFTDIYPPKSPWVDLPAPWVASRTVTMSAEQPTAVAKPCTAGTPRCFKHSFLGIQELIQDAAHAART